MTDRTPSAAGPGEVTGPIRVSRRQLSPSLRVPRPLRAAAFRVVRTQAPPTMALGYGTGDAGISQQHARDVLDLALRVGEAMLSTGASAADSVATVLRLGQAYGITSLHVDITYTSLSVSIHRGLYEDSITMMRVVKARTLDYSRLEKVHQLVAEIVRTARVDGGAPDVAQTRTRLKKILASPHPYRRWVVTLGFSLTSVGVVMLFGAGLVMCLIAAASGAVVDRFQRRLFQWGLPAFFTQAAAATVPTTLALILFVYEGFVPSVVVVAGIVILLMGLSVLGAAQDALDGYYVTAGARGLEVLLMTLGLTVGVAGVLSIAEGFGVSMEANAILLLTRDPLYATLGAAIIALGFSLSTYASARTTVASVLISSLAWGVYEVTTGVGVAAIPAVGISAVLVGMLAYVAHRRLRVPEGAIGTAGIVAFLPGLAVYRAIYLTLQFSPATIPMAAVHFINALAIGVALAAGMVLGGFFARQRLGMDRAMQRARRRSRGRFVRR